MKIISGTRIYNFEHYKALIIEENKALYALYLVSQSDYKEILWNFTTYEKACAAMKKIQDAVMTGKRYFQMSSLEE